MYKIGFTLGDWENKVTYHMKSNYPAKELNDILKCFEKVTGCDILSWYGDRFNNKIKDDDIKTLLKLSIISEEELNTNGEYIFTDPIEFVDLISRIIKYHLTDFYWDSESFDDEETLYIDGCGV